MRYHWQNLNEDKRGDVKGSGFWFGRAWLDISQWKFRLEWQFGKFGFRQKISFDPNEREIMLSFGLPGISLYLSIGSWKRLSFLGKLKDEREIGIAIHSWSLWWSVWKNTMEWNSRDPWWMRGIFHIDDFFLGRTKVTREIIEERPVSIPMPEGVYAAKATMERFTRKRSRWFKSVSYFINIEILNGGIPHEGKGENSWDCGTDGLCGMSTIGTSYSKAIGEVISSVLESRRKYDGNMMAKYPTPVTK